VGFRSDFSAALDRDGRVAGWNETDGLTDYVTGLVRSTTGRRTLVLDGQLGAGPVTLGTDQFAIVEIHGHDADDGVSGDAVRRRIDLVIAHTDPTIVRRQRLAKADGIWPAAVASSPRGDVAAAWVECQNTCFDVDNRLRVAVRAAGTRHLTVQTIAPALIRGGDTAGLAFNKHGDLLVSYLVGAGAAIAARVRLAGGDFGPEQIVATRPPRSDFSGPIRCAIAANGRIAIAWGTYDIRAVVRDAGASSFRRSRLLEVNARKGDHDSGPDPVPTDLHLAMGADGQTIVTWGEHTHLRMATAGRTGNIGQPVLVTDNYHGHHDVAVAPDGRALIAWDDRTTGISARLRRSGADAFGGRVLVLATPSVEALQAAFDPRTGKPTIVWPADDGIHTATRSR
jgi:hypothetical protein